MSARQSTAREDHPQPAPPVERRTLRFDSYAAARAEIERLRAGDYQTLGQWDLGQICFHLNYYYRGSLEGFGFMTPWIIRATLGRWHFNSWTKSGKIKAGMMTIAASRPTAEIDGAAEIETALAQLSRLETQTELQPSPLFGKLDREQWQALHLLHTAHHLAFLRPVDST